MPAPAIGAIVAVLVVVLEAGRRLALRSRTDTIVPLLDTANLTDAHELRRVAKHLGVFRLTGHGIDVESVLNASRTFFAKPEDLKQTARSSTGTAGGFQRGYIPLAGESGLRDFVELKEGFCYGRAPAAASTLTARANRTACDELVSPNAWPVADDDVGEPWQGTLEKLVDENLALTNTLHAALSAAMRKPADFLAQLAAGGEDISLMRLFHYFSPEAFPHVAPGVPRTGSSPHTDWHLVTVVMQDTTGGLQVRRPRPPYDWIDVPAVDGELIVILGDYLSVLSEGAFVSPVHRVLLPTYPNERYSFTYFRYPHCAATAPTRAAQRAERLARRRARERRRHPAGDTKFNTLVAPGPDGQGLGTLATSPWGELLINKWNGVASNKA